MAQIKHSGSLSHGDPPLDTVYCLLTISGICNTKLTGDPFHHLSHHKAPPSTHITIQTTKYNLCLSLSSPPHTFSIPIHSTTSLNNPPSPITHPCTNLIYCSPVPLHHNHNASPITQQSQDLSSLHQSLLSQTQHSS